jgi:hypothetical protein
LGHRIASRPGTDIKRLLDNAHGSMMEHVIDACASGFYAAPMADEVEGFFVAHPVPGAQRKIAQVSHIPCPSVHMHRPSRLSANVAHAPQVIEGTKINADILARAVRSRLAQTAFWDELIRQC